MISKNNQQLRQLKTHPVQTRFALRKLGTGLASVAIATLVTVGVTTTGHADTSPAPENDQPITMTPVTPAATKPATPTPQGTASDSNLAKQTIINSANNATVVPETNGLQHSLTVSANGQSTTPGAGSSIMNANELNQDGTFTATATVTNTSKEKQRVDQIITLPGYGYVTAKLQADPNRANPVIDESQLPQGAPQLVYNFGDAQSANAQVFYALAPGQQLTLEALKNTPNFSWNQVIEMWIITDLLPGQSYTMTIPMKVANMDQMRKQLTTLLDHPATSAISNSALRVMTFQDLFYYWNAQGQLLNPANNTQYVRLGVPDIKTTNELLHNASGYYVAQTLIKQGDHFTYSPIPPALQALLPHVNSSDIHIVNFSNGTNADLLFTDGSYTIDTAPIFNALKNAGYATNIYPSGVELWPVYTYNATNHLNVTFNDQGDGQGLIPSLDLNPYVQVQQIFNPKDITIPVNSQWDQSDNLNAAPSIEYTDRKTMSLTAHPTLTFNQDPNSGLNTYQVDYSALPTEMVNDHLVVTKAGVYPVVFSHRINDHDIVTATAYVTVIVVPKGSETTPDQPAQPEQPTNPDTTPEAPTQPGQPIQPTQPGQPMNPTPSGRTNQPGQPADTPTPAQAMSTSPTVPVTPGVTPAKTRGHAEKRLPQTGNDHPAAAAILGLFGLTAGLGLLATEKKSE